MNSDHSFATIDWTAKCLFLVFQMSEIALIGHLLNQNHCELFKYRRENTCYCSKKLQRSEKSSIASSNHLCDMFTIYIHKKRSATLFQHCRCSSSHNSL